VLRFKAGRSGQTAAAGVEQVDIGSRGAHEFNIGLHCHQRLLVAVALDDEAAASQVGNVPVSTVFLFRCKPRDLAIGRDVQ
jgi:hypothetical protein